MTLLTLHSVTYQVKASSPSGKICPQTCKDSCHLICNLTLNESRKKEKEKGKIQDFLKMSFPFQFNKNFGEVRKIIQM